MSTTVRGFNIRDLTQHGKAEMGQVNVNVKALPLTATSSPLFTVTGAIQVNALIGVVTVAPSAAEAFGLTLTDGATVFNIAAAQAAAAAPAAGAILILPPALGSALPAAVTAITATTKAASFFVVSSGGVISVTTSAVITAGTVAWVLAWSPLYPKNEVATVVNN